MGCWRRTRSCGHRWCRRGRLLRRKRPPPRGKPLRVSPSGLHPPRLAAHLWTYTTSWDINARARFTDHGHREHAWVATGLLARSLCAIGDAAQALTEAETLLADVAERGTWGEAVEAAIHLHLVLAQVGDPRASDLLATAYHGTCAQAERCADFVSHEAFMAAKLSSREICAAWAAAQAKGSAPGPAAPAA